MKKIKLTQGQYTIVDDEDFELLSQYGWYAEYSKGYYRAKAWVKDQYIFMSRFIMDCPKGLVVDHINHNTLDNRRSNLRICTQAENVRNSSIRKDNKTGFPGIMPRGNKWVAVKRMSGKQNWLGTFDTLEEAKLARGAI